jgi:hypothetical protein
MRKEKLELVRSPGKASTSGTFARNSSVHYDESEDEPNTSCLSAANGALTGGDLICGKLRLLTEELKCKFTRKKSRNSSLKSGSSLPNSEVDRSLCSHNDCNNNSRRSRNDRVASTSNEVTEHESFVDIGRESGRSSSIAPESRSPFVHRALPPLPADNCDEPLSTSLVHLSNSASTSVLGGGRFALDSSGDESIEANVFNRRSNCRQMPNDSARLSIFSGSTCQTRFGYIPPPHLQRPTTFHAFDLDDEDETDSVELNAVDPISSRQSSSNNVAEVDSLSSTHTNSDSLNNSLIPQPIESIATLCNSLLVENDEEMRKMLDYAASIEKVKDCGWYWGPISGDKAEKLLANEPDGSFIVRDSSDEHYIFSLTFKLNGAVRHVRIEHDQGEFQLLPVQIKVFVLIT